MEENKGMRINHDRVKENKDEKSDDMKTGLVVAIEMIEDLLHADMEPQVRERFEDQLHGLKLQVGLILDAEINQLGMKDGFYTYSLNLSDGRAKLFFCDPDDAEFYQMCIKSAVELDQNPDMRKRRLQEKETAEVLGNKVNTPAQINSVEDALKRLKDLTPSDR